ncbi:hypothetical protein MKW98_008305 [Papaver atlanticum]|uniref:Uncharacterized protein n=1 Tax=Papaver atlanticum TaxID=357466 RepID=A0AAD4XA37_9MAGN|nr:hypothetical protein MKW98_008305 [Papaver atlanticum]
MLNDSNDEDERLEISWKRTAITNEFSFGFVGPNGLNWRAYLTDIYQLLLIDTYDEKHDNHLFAVAAHPYCSLFKSATCIIEWEKKLKDEIQEHNSGLQNKDACVEETGFVAVGAVSGTTKLWDLDEAKSICTCGMNFRFTPGGCWVVSSESTTLSRCFRKDA